MTNVIEAESNSKDTHELKMFFLNQFKLLSNQMDGRFNALEKRLHVQEGQQVSLLAYFFSKPYLVFLFKFQHYIPLQLCRMHTTSNHNQIK
jgi:hypothetical protein